jgi:hypothetical protein
MRTALVVLSCLGVLVQGCHSGVTGQQIADEVAPRSMVADEVHAPSAESAVDLWLRERSAGCRLSTEERKAKLQRIEQIQGERTLRDDLQKLALASCQPELTPGLLREALNAVASAEALAEGQRQLIALIAALDRSSRLLETRNEQLKAELERTIKGIRDIETDIDGIHQNGGGR